MTGLLLALLWLAGVAAVSFAGYLVVSRMFGAGLALGIKVVLTLIALLIAQYLIGMSLLLFGAFGLTALLAIFLVSATYAFGVMRSAETRSLVRADLIALRTLASPAPVSGRRAWLFAVPIGIGWLTILRAALTPPMDWDFLTYHGPRAAFWVQEGTLVHSYDAVGVWEAYQAFPIAGDLISAWAMVLASGDAAVAPIWIAIWLAVGIVAFVAVRGLDGSRLNAALCATAVLTIPGAFHHMSSGYVDNAVALALLSGVVCFVEAEKSRNPLLATIAIAAWSIAVAVKLTALPFLALGGLLWAWLHYRDRAQCRMAPTALGLGIACLTALAWPGYMLATTGNPIYPFGITLFGIELAGATAPAREAGAEAARDLSFLEASAAFFWGGFYRDPILHNGFGPGGLLLVLAGAAALFARGVRQRLAFTATACCALFVLLWILATRIHDPGLDEARYIVIAAALAAVALARLRTRWATGLLTAAIAANLVYALPWRWSVLDAMLVPACIAAGLLIALLTLLARSGREARWRPTLTFAVVSLGTALAIGTAARDMYLIGLGQGIHFNSGPVAFSKNARAFPIWNTLADARPMVVAVTAGTWTHPMHWYLYPLFGDRLQHQLLHIPTGLYYRDERDAASPADIDRARRQWLADIAAADVDAVVLYAPDPVERRWVDANPQMFRLIAEARDGESTLYRVVRDTTEPLARAATDPAVLAGGR